MVQRPRTIGTLSLCFLTSLALVGCDTALWESESQDKVSQVEVGNTPTFASGGEYAGAPSDPVIHEEPTPEGQESDEVLDPPSDEQETPAPEEAPTTEAETPPDEEKPLTEPSPAQEDEEEEPAPTPPVEEPAAEEDEEESSISSNSTSAQEAPEITISLPPFAKAGTPIKMTSSTKGPVGYVFYEVDSGTGIGAGMGASFELSYTFWSEGSRKITVRGYNDSGKEVASDSAFIVVLPAGEEAPSGSDSSTPPPADSSGCPSGKVEDCKGVCVNASWVGDGICDDGANTYVDFMCEQFNNDGGDCGSGSSSGSSSGCAVGEQKDCKGLCVKSKWIGDDFCDDGTEYNVDLNCEAFNFDEGDCAGSSSSGSGTSGSGSSGSSAGNLSQVPYFYQYHNSLHPSASCQNTSIAMVLKYYGWSGTPDTITSTFGKNKAQSPAGLAEVFNHYAKNIGIPQRIVPHTNGSIAGLKALLAAGKPVIIHGYFTGFGHVLVVTGYNGSGYVVNDPAGKWTQTWKGGYPFAGGANSGKQLTYGASAFELAVSSTNGSNYAPLWYHEIIE